MMAATEDVGAGFSGCGGGVGGCGGLGVGGCGGLGVGGCGGLGVGGCGGLGVGGGNGGVGGGRGGGVGGGNGGIGGGRGGVGDGDGDGVSQQKPAQIPIGNTTMGTQIQPAWQGARSVLHGEPLHPSCFISSSTSGSSSEAEREATS
ncbi:hypothetical protein M0R45_037092 [Rubus argutus]|uniref:Uncharacterized protein n=1 Tax=Rubus argutus TaxID=59490 RepID=A0AAW1W3E9_RUBAR